MSGESTSMPTQAGSTQPGQTVEIATGENELNSLKATITSFRSEQLEGELKEQLVPRGKMDDYGELMHQYKEQIESVLMHLNSPSKPYTSKVSATTGYSTTRTALSVTIKTGATGVSSDQSAEKQGMPSVYCFAQKTEWKNGDGEVQHVAIDLAEVVKRPAGPAEALPALFRWAQGQIRGTNGKVTLTAATKGLVPVYERYGFTIDPQTDPTQRQRLSDAKTNKFAAVNIRMVLTGASTQ